MASQNQPNLLVLVADDLRYDAISACADAPVHTPHLDRLVADGCTFTRAHNMGSEHGAVCVPARAMIHSGRSLFRLDGPGNITADHPCLGEALADTGYHTFATGKWHNGQEAFNRSFAAGRNVFFGGMDDHWNVPVCDRRPLEAYPSGRPHRFDPGDPRGVVTQRRSYERYESGRHSSELFADTLCEHLFDRADDDQPFFAYGAFMAPHDPRTAPGEYLARYDPDELPLSPAVADGHPINNGYLHTRDEDLAPHPRDEETIRRHLADYYGIISHLDAQVGRILDTLERTGLADNTIVVFTADHGLAVGRHGLLGKQNVYEHSVRIPLVLAGPGLPEGITRDAFTYHFDLYPTLADLLEFPQPATGDGESLVSVIEDDADGPRETAFTAFGDTQRAVRTDRYKLIEYVRPGDPHVQLFDLENDPHETENLGTDPDHADVRDRLTATLADAKRAVNDPLAPA